jgi:hypothetical protein
MRTDKLVTIPLGDDFEIRLRTKMFVKADDEGEEVDMDKLLRIDMANIEAELVTFSVVLNMLGMVLAEVTNNYNISKLNLEIYESKRKEELRKAHMDADDDEEEEEGKSKRVRARGRKPLSIDEVESRLGLDKVYQAKKRQMYQAQKEMEQINSLYWSAKSKDDRLNKLSLSIKAGDIYDNLAASKLKRINNVDISAIKPVKKDS